MKILNFDNYISEKKKINPLTIGDFKKLSEANIIDWRDIKNFELKKIPLEYDNLKDGYILRLRDNDLHLVMSSENMERLYLYPGEETPRNGSNYYFMARDVQTSTGFCYVTSNNYDENLISANRKIDVIELYSSVFSCDMLKTTDELKEVCELIKHSDAYIKRI